MEPYRMSAALFRVGTYSRRLLLLRSETKSHLGHPHRKPDSGFSFCDRDRATAIAYFEP